MTPYRRSQARMVGTATRARCAATRMVYMLCTEYRLYKHLTTALGRPTLGSTTLDKRSTRHRNRRPPPMRYLNAAALLLVIVGAVNWFLVGIAKFDLVATLTGNRFGETNAISSIVYILVGIAGVILLPALVRWATPRTAEQIN